MSVDNNAILFLGLPVDQVDHTRIPGLDLEYWEDDAQAALDILPEPPLTEGLELTTDNMDNDFIGFKLGDSGSYGCIELQNLAAETTKRTNMFRFLFRVEPKIYLFNYQW